MVVQQEFLCFCDGPALEQQYSAPSGGRKDDQRKYSKVCQPPTSKTSAVVRFRKTSQEGAWRVETFGEASRLMYLQSVPRLQGAILSKVWALKRRQPSSRITTPVSVSEHDLGTYRLWGRAIRSTCRTKDFVNHRRTSRGLPVQILVEVVEMLNAPALRGDGCRLIRIPGSDHPTFRESDSHFLHFSAYASNLKLCLQ
jgi:hypothetical protein